MAFNQCQPTPPYHLLRGTTATLGALASLPSGAVVTIMMGLELRFSQAKASSLL